MAVEILRTKSIVATASLAGSQYRFVKIDTNGQIVIGTVGAYCAGVLQDKPTAGEAGSVCSPGDLTKVVCGAGGTITAGDNVSCDSLGAAKTSDTSGQYILGVALSAGAIGGLLEMLYQPQGKL